MANYRLIMHLLLAGSSYRTIQARCGAAHATIAKATKPLDEYRITTPAQLDGYHDDDLAALVGDGRMTVTGGVRHHRHGYGDRCPDRTQEDTPERPVGRLPDPARARGPATLQL